MALPQFGSLVMEPALDHLDYFPPRVAQVLQEWATVEPRVHQEVEVTTIDPAHSDTATLVELYGLDTASSANCVLVAGKRAGEERIAAVLVRANTRADVNGAVRRLLDVRKASFLPQDQAVELSGMEYGGITPVGVPTAWRILVDQRVIDGGAVLIGAGYRSAKLAAPGELF
ncbi:MAG: hypothetical protein LBO75_04580, partial [Bifidobacteriaceae bacterium]|nr:hypothetical protein [Bifidobacteriaceae bacterium]